MAGKAKVTVEDGSGNVFADLGFPNAEREQVKAHLTLRIYRLIKSRNLTQAAAGRILGVGQPHVSALMRGQSGVFSLARLMEFLTALGQDVDRGAADTPGARRDHGRARVMRQMWNSITEIVAEMKRCEFAGATMGSAGAS